MEHEQAVTQYVVEYLTALDHLLSAQFLHVQFRNGKLWVNRTKQKYVLLNKSHLYVHLRVVCWSPLFPFWIVLIQLQICGQWANKLSHVNHTANAVTTLHILESGIHITECFAVRNILIYLEIPLKIIFHKTRQLRSTLYTSKCATPPHPSSDKLER